MLRAHGCLFPDPGEFDKAAKWLAANWAIYDGEEAAALAWLLDFLQLGIEALSAGQRVDRIWEVLDSLRTPDKARRITMAALDVLQAHGIEVVQQYITTGVADFPASEGAFRIAREYHSAIRRTKRRLCF